MSKKKPFDFSVKSDKLCKYCGKPLKANLVERKSTAKACYKCFQERKPR